MRAWTGEEGGRMPRVGRFELFAEDPVRAVCFYQTAFGWEIRRTGDQPYGWVTTGPKGRPGINGGIAPRSEARCGCVNTIEVPSLDEYLERVVNAGGRVVVPKMPVSGMGWLAYCRDTEGNTFGLMQPNRKAK